MVPLRNLVFKKKKVKSVIWCAIEIIQLLVCLQIAHKYLVEKNLSPADDTEFKEQLYRIWFELYARRGSSRWVEKAASPEESDTLWQTATVKHKWLITVSDDVYLHCLYFTFCPTQSDNLNLRQKDVSDDIFTEMTSLCLPPGRTLQGLNTCLSARREVGVQLSAFTTGSSSTCKKSWGTLITRDTASMQIHPRYNAHKGVKLCTVCVINYCWALLCFLNV